MIKHLEYIHHNYNMYVNIHGTIYKLYIGYYGMNNKKGTVNLTYENQIEFQIKGDRYGNKYGNLTLYKEEIIESVPVEAYMEVLK